MNQPTLIYRLDLQLFGEDNPTAEDDKDKSPTEKRYLEVIKDYKENYISKEEYQKVLDENKKLLDEYLDGEKAPGDEHQPADVTEDQLREDLYGGKKKLTNLEYWEKTLALREKVMARGLIDPMVPVGPDMTPEDRHFAAAAKICNEVQDCIAKAGGDPEKFNDLLDKKIIGGLPKAKR